MIPKPLFDTAEFLMTTLGESQPSAPYVAQDIEISAHFLKAYIGSPGTFNSYRREVEKLLHWGTLIQKKSLSALTSEDIEAFIHFCQNPPLHWIATDKWPRFVEEQGRRISNPDWRPFVSTITKAARAQGMSPEAHQFQLSFSAVHQLFAILRSFYAYLVQQKYVSVNPVALVRQKNKFLRHFQQGQIRRLSEAQWKAVLEAAHRLVDQDVCHERTLFMISLLYLMYLRISELVASGRWTPLMNHFYRDLEGNWWFTTVGKGNKQRHIAVSDSMLEALKRWRCSLNLSPLPSAHENLPLIPKSRGKGPLASINHVRRLVQLCFDQAILHLKRQGLAEEADLLQEATVHWLRHTGISEDVKRRPREHVRDDAGHSSSAITDRYIDITMKERHHSAKDKPF